MLSHWETRLSRLDGAPFADQETRRQITLTVDSTRQLAVDLKLKLTKLKANLLLFKLSTMITISDAKSRICEVRETMAQELGVKLFLPATTDMVEYLDKQLPYGKAVATVFPCSEDIAESHQCFALGRYTASMFHLGRAMELAVKRLAKKMQIPNLPRDEWQKYLTAMNEKIAKMPFNTPKEKAKRASFAAATAYFLHFKEAWRNPTMHPKKTYTREEALDVIDGAGAFLRYTARDVFKAKD